MRTLEITAEVSNPEVIQLIKKAKIKKAQLHTLFAEGIHAANIPAELKISLK